MIGCQECKTLTRRSFLARAGVGAGAVVLADPLLRLMSAAYAQSTQGTGNLLVLCQLNGGFDALSFLAPYRNPAYLRKRPLLAIGEADILPLPGNSEFGFHRYFSFFDQLYRDGQLAIVQQVGYPDANGSHFESQEIYEYGVHDVHSRVNLDATWYERLRKQYFNGPFGVLDTATIGDPREYGYYDNTYYQAGHEAFGRLARLQKVRNATQQAVADAYDRIDSLSQDIQSRTADFQSTGEKRGEFYHAAALAYAGLGTKIIKLSVGGFDTHASQIDANASLFPSLNDQFAQFVGDLKAMGMWEKTCICFYSEFGRRNEENASPGTDHGYGGHMILAGPRVRGGLHGQNVSTADINADSLPYYVDFRAVFGSCIKDWLGFDPKPVFELPGERYDANVGSALFA